MSNTASKKTVLITGASRGIGKAILEKFQKEDWYVIATGTNHESVQRIENSLDHGIAYQLDLASRESITHFLGNLAASEHNPAVIVNNAGVTKDGLAIRMSDEDWQQVIDVNLTGCFYICRAFAKSLMKLRYGRIINIGSVVGSTGNIGQVNYCASKAGLLGLTRALALELAPRGITVNCIAPGFIRTDMTDKLNEVQQTRILERVPAGRLGEGHDIATAAYFLASEETAYITGQVLHVNGGMYLGE